MITLDIYMESEDVKILNQNKMKIALVKDIYEEIYTTNYTKDVIYPRVVWTSFSPFQHNLVTWDELYFPYVTRVNPYENIGKRVVVNSKSDIVSPSNCYSYNYGGFEVEPEKEKVEKGVGIYNLSEDNSLSFGILQSVIVDSVESTAPIDIIPIFANQLGRIKPSTKIYVFISIYNSGSLIAGEILDNTFSFDFENKDHISISYNSDKKTFVKI